MGHHGSFTDDSPPILTKETSNTDGDLPTVIPMGHGDEKSHTEQFSNKVFTLISAQRSGDVQSAKWLVGLDFY